MAVLKSRDEMANELVALVGDMPLGRLPRDIEVQLDAATIRAEIITRDCEHCDKPIKDDQRAWVWYGTPHHVMHTHCFLDWLPRVFKDADQIINASA